MKQLRLNVDVESFNAAFDIIKDRWPYTLHHQESLSQEGHNNLVWVLEDIELTLVVMSDGE